MKNLILSLTLILLVGLSAPRAVAQVDHDHGVNIHLLYGEGFEPDGADIATLTIQDNLTYGVYEHYGFIDLFNRTDEGDYSAHMEWYPKFSLSRSGHEIEAGPLTDIALGGGLNADFQEGENAWVWLAGPTWKFSIPGFQSFAIETYYYRPVDYGGMEFEGTYQITPAWDILMPVHEQLEFRFTGFIDFIGERGPGEHQIISHPQLLLDVGNLWGDPGTIYTGTEWRYWYNKGGQEGVTESVFQLGLRVDL